MSPGHGAAGSSVPQRPPPIWEEDGPAAAPASAAVEPPAPKPKPVPPHFEGTPHQAKLQNAFALSVRLCLGHFYHGAQLSAAPPPAEREQWLAKAQAHMLSLWAARVQKHSESFFFTAAMCLRHTAGLEGAHKGLGDLPPERKVTIVSLAWKGHVLCVEPSKTFHPPNAFVKLYGEYTAGSTEGYPSSASSIARPSVAGAPQGP